MQRQRTDILSLDTLYPNFHPFHRTLLIDNHSDRIGKIGLRVKIFGQRKGIFCRAKLLDAVKSVSSQLLVAQTASHNIPPLPEHLNAVGCHFERALFQKLW